MSSRNYRRNGDFEAHASPEAINAMLMRERETAKRISRRVEWLEGLLARRTAEKAAGTWPPTEPAQQQGDTDGH